MQRPARLRGLRQLRGGGLVEKGEISVVGLLRLYHCKVVDSSALPENNVDSR